MEPDLNVAFDLPGWLPRKRGPTNVVEMVEMDNGYVVAFLPALGSPPPNADLAFAPGRVLPNPGQGISHDEEKRIEEYRARHRQWKEDEERRQPVVRVYPALSAAIEDITKFLQTGFPPRTKPPREQGESVQLMAL